MQKETSGRLVPFCCAELPPCAAQVVLCAMVQQHSAGFGVADFVLVCLLAMFFCIAVQDCMLSKIDHAGATVELCCWHQ